MNSHVGSWSPKKIFEFSERNCKGQNSLPWRVICIIGKLSKCRCRKWARMSHLDICNTSYDKKKGRESNWKFDSRPLKVRNRLNPSACRWSVTHRWKALDEGYNFASNLIMIGGLQRKLCALKIAGVPIVGISGLPFGSPETKSHLNVAPMESRRVYYMGEGGGFPWVQAMVSLVSPKLPMARLSTKGVWESELINLWLVGFRFEWVI